MTLTPADVLLAILVFGCAWLLMAERWRGHLTPAGLIVVPLGIIALAFGIEGAFILVVNIVRSLV